MLLPQVWVGGGGVSRHFLESPEACLACSQGQGSLLTSGGAQNYPAFPTGSELLKGQLLDIEQLPAPSPPPILPLEFALIRAGQVGLGA